jgi:DNA replication protein DnaC
MSHTLADRFSQLKLRGCARAYLEQEGNPNFAHLSFDDRLTLLLEREELERANRVLSLRISQARFKQSASFDTLTPNSARGLDQTLLKTLGTCDFVRKKRNILITGPSGCGKSYLATALSHQACLMGFSAKYYRAPSTSRRAGHERGRRSLFKSCPTDQ